MIKHKNGFSNIKGVFKFGRSGVNLSSTINSYDGTAKFRELKRNFLIELVVSFWNNLPTDIKMDQSIDSFKFMLEEYKLSIFMLMLLTQEIFGSCLMKFYIITSI